MQRAVYQVYMLYLYVCVGDGGLHSLLQHVGVEGTRHGIKPSKLPPLLHTHSVALSVSGVETHSIQREIRHPDLSASSFVILSSCLPTQ